jgi:YebC/PmpR family DNA-binding regulatory protein
MSGHSKWSKVKHQKAVTDAVKGREFTKASRAITIAVREGGGIADPNQNFRLRLAVEKARMVNVPKENIQRAIEKGKGTEGVQIEQMMYEGYGPGGVAMCIDAATDNRQRTVAAVKALLDRGGGTLASPGAVSYQFDRCGLLIVPKGTWTLDQVFEVALTAGATDVVEKDDVFEVYTQVGDLFSAKQYLEQKSMTPIDAIIIMRPKMEIEVPLDLQPKVDKLVEALEALDDVQTVFTNATH